MEYSFREKKYKVSGFKTFLINQLKKENIEIVYDLLIEFIQCNDFEYKDAFSILDRYIDYSKKTGLDGEQIYDFVSAKLKKFAEYELIESVVSLSNLYSQIHHTFALAFLEKNLGKIPNNSKEKVIAMLFKSELLMKNKEFDEAFSVLRDCSNQSYNLYIFDSLELKRTIYEKMAIIGDLENRSDVALNYYIYYCAFQASLEFLNFPYLDRYRNFRMSYSIVENPEAEIIQIDKHLKEKNIDLSSFNSFLQDLYKVEIPKAFKLENIDIANFTVSISELKELTYYSNYVTKLSVKELVSTLEFLTSQKIKSFY